MHVRSLMLALGVPLLWFGSAQQAGPAASNSAPTDPAPIDLVQTFTPQFNLRFIAPGTVPRRLRPATGTLTANPAARAAVMRLAPGALVDSVRSPGVSLSSSPGTSPGTSAALSPARTRIGTAAASTLGTASGVNLTALVGSRDLPFILPGRRSVRAAQFRAAAVAFSDRPAQELVSPDRMYRVRPVSGVFDFSVGRVDPAIWQKAELSPGSIVSSGFTSDMVPGVSHVMTFRNMTRDSRLQVSINRSALVTEDHEDFPATTIVISGQTPGIEVSQTSSDSEYTTYTITSTLDQDLGSIEFAPTTDIVPSMVLMARTTGSPAGYAERLYPPGVNPRDLTLTGNTVDYRRLFSPFAGNTPLDFRWSPVLDTTFRSLGLTHLTVSGKDLRAYTFPGQVVVDPVQLAWESNLGYLTSRVKRPNSPWQPSLTPAFCEQAFAQRARMAGLQGPGSVQSSGANVDLFGSTGACYFNGYYHEGTDFMVGAGSQIRAILSGRVHTSGYWNKAGGHVGIVVGEFQPIGTAITGPFYIEVQYLHLNHCKFNFRPNQSIQAGEVLGVTAATGPTACNTTYSPHLHIDTAVVYYDHKVMHKFYFDPLLFLGQADAFGMQLRKVLGASTGDGETGLPAPVVTRSALTACSASSGPVVTLRPNGARTCTLAAEYTPNGLKLSRAEFTYSLSYLVNGAAASTPVLPGTDLWTPTSGNVGLTSGSGRYTFRLPISVRQRPGRPYTSVNVMAHLTYSNGKSRDFSRRLPIST